MARVIEGYSGGPVILSSDEQPLCIGMTRLGGEGRMTMVAIGADALRNFVRVRHSKVADHSVTEVSPKDFIDAMCQLSQSEFGTIVEELEIASADLEDGSLRGKAVDLYRRVKNRPNPTSNLSRLKRLILDFHPEAFR